MWTAYLLFAVAGLLLILLVALVWRFWQNVAQVSPEEEELDRTMASLNDSQANRVSDEQIVRQMDAETGWQIMVQRGQQSAPRRRRR
nr:hypothetical protein [Oscillochloris trichoides]